MAEINWQDKKDQENDPPSKEDMNAVAILELAEMVASMSTAVKGGK